MDPISAGISIASGLVPSLAKLISDELADGQKSEAEATHAALVRLAADHAVPPVLPQVEAMIAEAEKPQAERDADANPGVPTTHS